MEQKSRKLTKDTKKLETEIEEIKNNKIYENAFEWRFEFPEVLNDEGDFVGFDTMIGNPPYGVSFGQHDKKYFNIQYKTTQYNYESYSFFFEKGLNLLRNNGMLDYITPNTFLVLEKGNLLRDFLFNQNRIIRLLEVFNVFKDAVVEPILCQVKKEPTNSSDKVNVFLHPRTLDTNIDSIKSLKSNSFSLTSINESENLLVNYRLDSNRADLLSKILKSSEPLTKIGNVTTGIKPYQVGKGKPAQTKKIVQSKPYTRFDKPNDEWKPLVRGTQINRYLVKWDNEYIHYGKWLAEPRLPEIFSMPKILIRRTDDNLMCCYDSSGVIGVNSVHSIQINSDSDISYMYLLGLLNSKLLNWVFQTQNFHMVGKPLAEVKVIFVERLPIINRVKIGTQQKLETLIPQILDLKKADPEADTTALEAEIDQLVYELYGLTENEINIVEDSVK